MTSSKDTELKENKRSLFEENLRLKNSEQRSIKIICILSIFITITISVLITILILKADEIFHSCKNGNAFISESMKEIRELHERTQKMNAELMDFVYSHEINERIRNKQILDEGFGFLKNQNLENILPPKTE